MEKTNRMSNASRALRRMSAKSNLRGQLGMLTFGFTALVFALVLTLGAPLPSYAASPTASCTNGAFSLGTLFPVGAQSRSVAAGDFNRDGKRDLAVANYASSSLSVLMGNGDGSFQTGVSYNAGSNPISVAVGDFNADGAPDLAAANLNSGDVSILLGNGDGTFQTETRFGAGGGAYTVVAGDLNGDGLLDLATANIGENTVSVLTGNGNGTFQPAMNYGAGPGVISVAVGDFNGDGKSDLVVSNLSGADVSVLMGNGDGTFSTAVDYAAGTSPFAVTVGDFNGDGKLDVATADQSLFSEVSVLLGNGDGTLRAPVNYAVGDHSASITAGDLNGDGRLDLVVGNGGGNSVSVLTGNGDGTFQPAVDYVAGTGPVAVGIADYNGDGKADLAVVVADNVSILLNTCVVSAPSQRELAQGVLDDLKTLRSTVTRKQDGKKLDQAIDHLTESLAPELWLDGDHLQSKKGETVFQQAKDTVEKLRELVQDKKSTITDVTLNGFIDRLVSIDRALATIAINDAISGGGNAPKLAQAHSELAKGDADAAAGKSVNAIEHYRAAWANAIKALKNAK